MRTVGVDGLCTLEAEYDHSLIEMIRLVISTNVWQ